MFSAQNRQIATFMSRCTCEVRCRGFIQNATAPTSKCKKLTRNSGMKLLNQSLQPKACEGTVTSIVRFSRTSSYTSGVPIGLEWT
ncbi:hypothetical protein D3C72_1736560 [compost metagenome]